MNKFPKIKNINAGYYFRSTPVISHAELMALIFTMENN